MLRLPPGICLLALVLSCSSDPNDSVDPLDVRLYPSHAFAGGEVFLSGDWYRALGDLPTITADTFVLQSRRVDDSTLAVSLPTAFNGPLTLRELVHQSNVNRGTVTVAGFEHRGFVPLPEFFVLTPSWSPNFPYLAIVDSLGLSVLDPRSDHVTRYDSIGSLHSGRFSCPLSAGPSFRPGEFLLFRPAYDGLDHWYIVPDTLRHQAVPLAGCMAAEVAAFVYATTDLSYLYLIREDSAGYFTPLLYDTVISNRRFYRSPGGQRLAFAAYRPEGAPVIDLQSMAPAFMVPSVTRVMDAAFSADGSRLYLAGSAGNLVVVNALTGDSIAGIQIDSILPRALALDSDAGLVFMAVSNFDPSDRRVFVLVLDAESLALVGRLDIPSTTDCGYCYENGVLMVDRSDSELLLVGPVYPLGVEIAHFGLPPVP